MHPQETAFHKSMALLMLDLDCLKNMVCQVLGPDYLKNTEYLMLGQDSRKNTACLMPGLDYLRTTQLPMPGAAYLKNMEFQTKELQIRMHLPGLHRRHMVLLTFAPPHQPNTELPLKEVSDQDSSLPKNPAPVFAALSSTPTRSPNNMVLLPATRLRVIVLLLSLPSDLAAFPSPTAPLGAVLPNLTEPLPVPFQPNTVPLQGVLIRILRDLGLFPSLMACPASEGCLTPMVLRSQGVSLRNMERQLPERT